jgi:hypothetical protein
MLLAFLTSFMVGTAPSPTLPTIIGNKPYVYVVGTTTAPVAFSYSDYSYQSNVMTGTITLPSLNVSLSNYFLTLDIPSNNVVLANNDGNVVVTNPGSVTAHFIFTPYGPGTPLGCSYVFSGSASTTTITNLTFTGFSNSTLGNVLWTNFTSNTNVVGVDNTIWATYVLPSGWPATGTPQLAWDTNCLLYKFNDFTAVSQCNTSQGYRGEVPFTLLTPRHAYARGHSMGWEGRTGVVTNSLQGTRVFFCTSNNVVVEADIWLDIGEITNSAGDDYTLVIFSNDVPASITPMWIQAQTNIFSYYPMRLGGGMFNYVPWVSYITEQTGHVCPYLWSTVTTPFYYNFNKGGDSGSPFMLPMPGTLVFFAGTTTSGLNGTFTNDLNALTVAAGLSTSTYKLRIYDFSAFPLVSP